MKKSDIVLGGLLAAVGLLLIAAPEASIKVIVIFLGIGSVTVGIFDLIAARKLSLDSGYEINMLIRGWTGIVVGILAVFLPLIFAATMWTVMLYILAVYLLVSAALQIYAIVKLQSAGLIKKGDIGKIVLSIVVAAILFAIPRSIGIMIVRILGVLCVVGGIGYILYEMKSAPIIENADNVSDDENPDDAANSDSVPGDESTSETTEESTK